MKELRWMNCHEGIDMNELKRMNRHETIIMKELKHMTWNAWIDMNIFESNELTWVNWNEWIDMTGLTLRNWTEWIEMNDLSTSSWRSGPSPSVFCVFYVKSSSGYSPVHILSTSSSKIWSEPVRFWRFLCDQLLDDDVVDRWNGAVATVVRTLCRPHCQPHLQKCQTHLNFSAIFIYVKSSSRFCLVHILSTSPSKSAKKNRQFFAFFKWNRALAAVRAHFVDHFPDQGAQPRKQRPSSGDRRRPLYPKKQKVLLPSVFSTVNSRCPDRSHSQLLGDDNDVIDMMVEMMMWLPWWWDS